MGNYETQQQSLINACANNILRQLKSSTQHCLHPDGCNFREWTRFNHCQAWISPLLDGRYKLVKSYETIVAIIDLDMDTLYELGKWSSTTSKQVTQIYNSMNLHTRYLVKN